jgi:hypothetical protein
MVKNIHTDIPCACVHNKKIGMNWNIREYTSYMCGWTSLSYFSKSLAIQHCLLHFNKGNNTQTEYEKAKGWHYNVL